ncbi:MAG: SDR family oxidoreductase, partial [Pseudomonadota bacterium]
GYPQDMLDLEMELEASLGIDSIKQVEILSALQERLPQLPETDPSALATLKTLRQIVEFVTQATGQETLVEAAVTAATPRPNEDNPSDVLLAVVAEKTGYPQEMLALEMELEADLGVDSIKQVEILSALQDRLPHLPETDPSELAELKTLAQIVTLVEKHSGAEKHTENADPCDPDEVPNQSHPGEGISALSRFVLRTEQVQPAGFAIPGLRDANLVAITPDDGGLAQALAAVLRQRDIAAEVTGTVPTEADALIFLGGQADDESSIAAHRSALRAAKAVAPRFAERGGVFVTVQDSGGSFGVEGLADSLGEAAWLAGLPGLVKTAALEWPQASVKAIDLEHGGRDAFTLATALADEMLAGGPEVEIGLRADGARLTLMEEALRVDAGELPLADEDVLVVTGGARGITAEGLKQLAAKRRLRLAMIGRTKLEDEPTEVRSLQATADLKHALLEAARNRDESPTLREIGEAASRIQAGREARRNLSALEAQGAKVRYLTLDVRDACAVNAALERLRDEWGPIHGLIHGVGVLADKRIEHKSEAQFDLVFGTKVDGLQTLLRATRNDPLKVLCMFSSVAARAGNLGQADYAMANEVLNKVAIAEAQRRSSTCVVKSINWGPWDGGMVDAGLRKHFADQGVGLIALDAGATFLQHEISDTSGRDVEVVASSTMPVAPRDRRMEVEVDAEQHPYLLSHVIQGRPVLPMVLVMEWFVRAARAAVPGLEPAVVRDLQVLKSVILEKLSSEPSRFEIVARPRRVNGIAQIELTLASRDGRVCYRALVELGPHQQALAEPQATVQQTWSPWPWRPSQVYEGNLFHGPDFQVIHELEGVGAEGGVGVFEGTLAKRWPGGPWLTDPAAIDGAMQLALLWGLKETSRVFLPMRIGSFIPRGPLPTDQRLRCQFRSRLVGQSRTENDFVFMTLEGGVVAEMRGVEMYPADLDNRGEPEG